MRTYGQYCALARALDLVGDRWSLLIVRELAIRPSRYSDLREGLPNIATNLLADRLRELTAAGIVQRTEAPPPIATTIYELTDWGLELVPILIDLARWAEPLMYTGPKQDDVFKARWLMFAVPATLGETVADRNLRLRVRFDIDEPVDVVIADGELSVELRPSGEADVVVKASPYLCMGLVAGVLTFDDPALKGAVTGSAKAKNAFMKLAAAAAAARNEAA